MPYIITNGQEYIKRNPNGKYVTIRNEALADEFKKEIAENVLKNHVPKSIRKSMHIKKVDTGVKEILNPIPIHSEKNETVLSKSIQDWIEKLVNLNGLAKEAEERRNILISQLSEVNKEICDLSHYIEFCTFNASQGYKACKIFKDLRQKRRKIKNELEIVDYILNKKMVESASEDISQLIDRINNRKYEPRVMKELFDV